MTPYLFLVHPGSALGSATFNLGEARSRAARTALCNEITEWDGHLIILGGGLDGELKYYPLVAQAIASARRNARLRHRLDVTRLAEDPNQIEEAMRVATTYAIPKDARIVCTGAWASRGTSGCVNSVHAALVAAGFTDVTISESAVYEDADDEAAVLEPARNAA